MLTIFAVPRAFRGKFKIIQENAIKSWINLGPDIEIILFGNEFGVGKIAKKYHLRYSPKLKKNIYGTPLVNSLFRQAELKGKGDTLLYINSDIILPRGFVETVRNIQNRFKDFLAIGERVDLDVKKPISFSKKSNINFLYRQANILGKRHGPTGIDYFLYNKNLWRRIPDFAIGRFYWDNWLVYEGLRQSKNLIDISLVVKVIHQDHPKYAIFSKLRRLDFDEEKRQNAKLAGKKLYNRFNANLYIVKLANFELILPSIGFGRLVFNLKKNIDHLFKIRLKSYFSLV